MCLGEIRINGGITMNFATQLANENNKTLTTNNAGALKSTMSPLVDLFGTIGALRERSDFEVIQMFSKAFAEDKLLALKMLFYSRDVRGGLGERHVPRIIYKHLAKVYPDILKKNLVLFPEYGRWDDLWVLLDTSLKEDVCKLVYDKLKSDHASDKPSLLGKWMPSENSSSKETKRLAKILKNGMGASSKQYRQLLSGLRAKIKIVETIMSTNEWNGIEYSKVPSRAMNIYRKAFAKHDEVGFANYLSDVEKGEQKINSSTLYPYDIVEKILGGEFNKVLEEQWKALPNYVTEESSNILVMADVSGSMTGRPMATSIGLAIYFAERNTGVYSNKFMTFSHNPDFVELMGDTLYEKVRNASNANWQMNTDFEKALLLILNTAIRNGVAQSELPKSLIVISDMQFDGSMMSYGSWTFYDKMKEKYSSYGYEIPNIVFWNVNNTSDAFQVSSDYRGVQLVSGQSPSTFMAVVTGVGKTPYELMYDTLNVKRYEKIRV